MLIDTIISVFGAVFQLAKPLLFICLRVLALFGVLCLYWFVRHKKDGVKSVKVEQRGNWRKRGILARFFIDFPRQLTLDKMRFNPNDFSKKGVVIFTGRQGNGKSIAMTQAIREDKARFPQCKVITNYGFVGQDTELNHWKLLTDYNNGSKGVVVGMDETQNWFSSAQSKNFPPEMLQVVTQNRKNRRIIYGTAQNFYLLAKAIRSQTTEVRECRTLFGCITFVRRREPVLDCDGNVTEWIGRGVYFFVHSDELRNCYDTYRCINSLSKSGFNERVTLYKDA